VPASRNVLAVAATVVAGCSVHATASVRARVAADPAPGAVEEAPLRPPTEPPTLAPGVAALELPCGAPERCDAIDSDCDGAIDEGGQCPYESGPLQITVAWNSGADLDLYVTDPTGEVVSFHRPRGASGARLDHAGRGSCSEMPAPRIENYRFAGRPPFGEYVVELHYLFECEANAGPVTATVGVVVAGERVGQFNYTLSPNERAEVLRFTLP